MEMLIRCSKCAALLPADRFTPTVRRKGAGYCRACSAAYQRNYRTASCPRCDAPIRKGVSLCQECRAEGRRRPRAATEPREPAAITFSPRGRPQGARWNAIRRTVIDSSSVCGICGETVDKTLRWNDPRAATVDHIVPVASGGHPTDPANLRLAHRGCNSRDGARPAQLVERAEFARVAAEWALQGVF